MRAIFQGVGDGLRGARYLAARPHLFRYVLVPMVIAGGPLVAAWVGYGAIRGAIAAMFSWLPDSWLSATASAEVAVLAWALSLTYILFVAVLAVITTPFCELLSEVVEHELCGQPPPRFSVLAFGRDVILGVVHAIRRALAYLFTMGLLVFVGLVLPVIGKAVFVVGGLYVTLRFTAYDALDTVWARKGWSYGQKMEFLEHHRPRSYGLGAAIGAMLAVPVINLVAMPIGAVAATHQFLDVHGTSVQSPSIRPSTR